jgi:uncharacterized protein
MIVDVHTFVWDQPGQLGSAAAARLAARLPHAWDRTAGSVAALEQAAATIDRVVVLGFESDRLGAHIPSQRVAHFVSMLSSRAVGFAGIDPTLSQWRTTLDHAIALGLSGVVVSPAAQGFTPDFGPAMELFERCEHERLPVVVLPGLDLGARSAMELAQPGLLDNVARAFPELRMVIAQMGDPFIDQTLSLLDRHEHVYASVASVADRAWGLYQTLLAAHERSVISKLLLGSGFPWSSPDRAAHAVLSVNEVARAASLPLVPARALRDLVHRDALALLGVKDPGGPLALGPTSSHAAATAGTENA